MNTFTKITRKQSFKFFAIFLLLFSLITSSIPAPFAFADGSAPDEFEPGHGGIKNEEGEKDEERATINKQVNFGNKPGEYFIDLTVKGKDNTKIDTMDIVIPYDLSNSMENNKVPGTNQTRTKVAADATKDFINSLLGSDGLFKIAFVPYGTSIMDGKTRSYLQRNANPAGGNYNFNAINPNNYYVGEFTNNPSIITDKIPDSISHGNHGGTFTQQALERAGEIMQSSRADYKVIVTITDGLPTISYNANRQPWGTGAENQGIHMQTHRTNTINEANSLKENYTLYAIGIGLDSDNSAAREVIEGISQTPEDAYYANSVNELVAALNDITRKLSNSIVDGSITDPITEEFLIESGANFTEASNEDLTNGEYFLSASDESLLDGVTVTVEGNNLKVDGLNLGEGEEVTIRYKVQVDTDNLEIKPDVLYRTNGEAVLIPRGDNPEEKYEFPVPEASTVPIEVSGVKVWEDFGLEENRPDSLIVQLYRTIKGEETMVKEVEVTPNDEGKWKYIFEGVFLYDTEGDPIEYTVREVVPDQYEPVVEGTSITNKLIQKPAIELIKTGKSTSKLGENYLEVGKNINYTFTITNTGNLPLKNIELTDSLQGISDFTYETVNGDPFTGDIKDLVLKPGDVLVATASYTVTQEDFDYGQVENHAEVKGTPTVPEPTNEFDNSPVTDEDDAQVPADLNPAIELTKEADKSPVNEVGEVVIYTFTVKNTGNTKLTEITLNDPMLGGEITLPVDTLNPGESTTVTVEYETTQANFDQGKIINNATVEGTPPPAYTNEPGNPEKVTDQDEETVTAEQNPAIELIKEADKETLLVGEDITYTFTATNTGNTTLTNVNITDILDGISIIEYVTINDEEVLDQSNITLESGDVLVARATYKVTQDDMDFGQVDNEATVKGTDPNNEEVTDTDKEIVLGEQSPNISIEKKADKEEVTEVGEEIEFSFTVTNTGNVTLTDVKVTDPMLDDLGIKVELDKTTLLPGETATGKATYTVTQADLDKGGIKNLATATGTPPAYDPNNPPTDPEDPAYPPVSPPSEVEIPAKQNPALELSKDAEEEKVVKAGDKITYNFTVTNTGNVTLENVKVNDDMLEELDIDIELEKTTLAPDEVATATAVYIVTQEDIDQGFVKNVATSTGNIPGKDPEDPVNPESPPAENIVPVEQNPGISLMKDADKEKYNELGEEITYTFTVTNTGNVTLTDVSVFDETFGEVIYLLKEGEQGAAYETVTLAPGESATGTFTYTVTQEDLDNGEIHNLAKTEGTPPAVIDPENPDNPIEQDPVRAEDEETVKADQNPALSLEKSADKQEVERAGDEIRYTLTVTNTGNVTLTDVTVNDEMLGGDLAVSPSTLAPGESGTVTGIYVVTQDDINRYGEIINIATATGTPPGEDPNNPDNPTTPPTEEEVSVVKDPAIKLVKQADKESFTEAGETITYTFTATNTGNKTLTKVNIVDELDGISEIEYLTINDESVQDPANITLQPGDVLVAQASYDVTQEDLDGSELTNHAVVEGTPPAMENPEDPDNPIEQDPVRDDDDVELPGIHEPAIELEKTSNTEEVTEAGQIITYKFVVTNTGNVTLENVKVNDEMLEELDIDIELEKTTLAPGESTVAYAEYRVTQEDMDNLDGIINTATSTGTAPGKDPEDPDNPTTPPVEEETPVEKSPAIEVVKEANKEEFTEVGEEIVYTFTVTNTGNVTLTDIVLDDETLEVNINLEKTKLAPGEKTIGSFTYLVTQEDMDHGEIYNLVSATGTPPNYDPEDPDRPEKPRDEDEEKVTGKQSPDISLEKLVDYENVYEINGGDLVTYTFIVTNTGNVTLTDVEVNDPLLGGKIDLDVTVLAPGESARGTATYTITKEDYDQGYVDNHATATGTPPGKNPEDPDNPGDEDEQQVKTKHPNIQLIKTSDTRVITEVGQLVTYTFKVKNTGNVVLHDVTIEDPMFDNILLPITTLQPGETVEAYAQYTVSAEDLEKTELLNLAEVTGIPEGYDPKDPDSPQPPVDEDDEIIPTEKEESLPGIQLEKTADKKQVSVGDEVIYTFKVTNTGAVTLYDLVVEDPMIDGDIQLEKTNLEPGESTLATASYIVTEEDLTNDILTNLARVTGTPEGYDPEDPNSPEKPVDEDEEDIYTGEELPPMNPAIKLLKSTDTTVITEEGQVVTYFFKVTNTGDITLEDVSLFDPLLVDKNIQLDKTKLQPGESAYGQGSYVTTKSDIGKKELPNTAVAFGYSPKYPGERINLYDIDSIEDLEKELEEINEQYPGSVPEDEDDQIIPSVGSSIQLIKTTDTEVATEEGQIITYIFKIKNTGLVTLYDIELTDEMLGLTDEVVISELQAGETTYITVEYLVTEEDLAKDTITNLARVTGTPEGYDPEDPNSPEKPVDEDEENTPTEKGTLQPNIQLEKTSDKDVVTEVGEIVTYTFVVTNTGGVTLTDVEVYDPMVGGNVVLEQTTLAPGESTKGTATYEITEDNLTYYSIVNLATATGTPEGYDPEDPDSPEKPVDQDEDVVYPYLVPPAYSSIKLLKTSNTLVVTEAGQVVEYTFKVTNTGDTSLTDIFITDPLIEGEIVLEKTKLAPGESTYGRATYIASQEDVDKGFISNHAEVEGTPPGYNPEDPNSPQKPRDNDDIDVPVEQEADLTLEKFAEEIEVSEAGERITFHFVVTNTGNVTLTDVKVEDPMLAELGIEVELDQTTLAPGESAEGVAVYTVTQDDIDNGGVYNVATATGTPPGYDPENPPTDPEDPAYPPVSPPDEVEVPGKQNPALELEKRAEEKEVSEAGERITFHFVVTNTGNVTLTDVKVEDPMLAELGIEVELDQTTLAPGESAEGVAVYTVTQEDIDNGGVYNVATATGTPPGYDPENPPTDPEDPAYPPVSPPDEVEVPGKQNPAIKLEKLANKEEITEVREEIIYTFTITNIGNVSLYDLVLTDPMLGGEIRLDQSTLAPGETIEVSVAYSVTAEDAHKVSIVNEAEVTATTKTGQSTSSEDDVTVNVNIVKPGEELPKTATNMFNYLLIGGLTTLVGAIAMIYTRRRHEV